MTTAEMMAEIRKVHPQAYADECGAVFAVHSGPKGWALGTGMTKGGAILAAYRSVREPQKESAR